MGWGPGRGCPGRRGVWGTLGCACVPSGGGAFHRGWAVVSEATLHRWPFALGQGGSGVSLGHSGGTLESG